MPEIGRICRIGIVEQDNATRNKPGMDDAMQLAREGMKPTPKTTNTENTMTNKEQFKTKLAEVYQDLFANDPDYSYSSSKCTPQGLSEKMTESLIAGGANKDGEGIKRTCRAFGIKHTYAAIREFLTK